MAVDIHTIPHAELRCDLQESLDDIAVCKRALLLGVTRYSGGSVQDRLDANKGFIVKIKAELARCEALGDE